MLQGIFSGIGPISEVKVIKDNVSNKSAGYGFVKFLDPQVAELAMQQINRRVLFNQVRRCCIVFKLASEQRGCVRRAQRASAAMCTWCALDFRLPAAGAQPRGVRSGPDCIFVKKWAPSGSLALRCREAGGAMCCQHTFVSRPRIPPLGCCRPASCAWQHTPSLLGA